MAAHDYKTLIRLNRFQVDERSKKLVALQAESQRLTDRDSELGELLERERIAAMSSIEAGAMYGAFSNGIAKRRERIAAEQVRLRALIDKARDDLRAAMGEVKKFEIAEGKARESERREEAGRQSQLLDETALEGFRRKQEERE